MIKTEKTNGPKSTRERVREKYIPVGDADRTETAIDYEGKAATL